MPNIFSPKAPTRALSRRNWQLLRLFGGSRSERPFSSARSASLQRSRPHGPICLPRVLRYRQRLWGRQTRHTRGVSSLCRFTSRQVRTSSVANAWIRRSPSSLPRLSGCRTTCQATALQHSPRESCAFAATRGLHLPLLCVPDGKLAFSGQPAACHATEHLWLIPAACGTAASFGQSCERLKERVTTLPLADYPFKPPKVAFNTKVYHPNINSQGSICLVRSHTAASRQIPPDPLTPHSPLLAGHSERPVEPGAHDLEGADAGSVLWELRPQRACVLRLLGRSGGSRELARTLYS